VIDRRTFITSLALGTVALPHGVLAQRIGKAYRIGMLWAGTPATNVSRENAFRDGLRELGWIEGRTIVFEERWADGNTNLRRIAAQLIALKVDLIVAPAMRLAARAALAATRGSLSVSSDERSIAG
jgi:putative ABC transport system substrate-binding protein